MNFAIRVDASTRIGFGHMVRCRTLAQALCKSGASVQFVCRAHPGDAIDDLRSHGFTVSALPAPARGEVSTINAGADDYAEWLGVAQGQDATETIDALDARPDWLVVDHYGLDIEWERCLRPHGDRILVIDDLAGRDHDCDALLDQNYGADEAHHQRRLPAHTHRLLGPYYALLRWEYTEYRRALKRRDGHVRRVLLFFGGTDSNNMSGRALEALSADGLRDLVVDVVVGVNHPHRQALADQASHRPGTCIHRPRPHLADLMVAADLAVGAGGATTWERCCLGLPSLIVSITDNQRPACEALAADGLITYMGHWDDVTAADLREGIMGLVHDPERLRTMSDAMYRVVDGAGTERVVRHLLTAV